MLRLFAIVVALCLFNKTLAHPMPGSLVNLTVLANSIKGQAKIPFIELQNALGKPFHFEHLNTVYFKQYFSDHIHARSTNSKWTIDILQIDTAVDMDPIVGKYKEVLVNFVMKPEKDSDLRDFLFEYDAVIHQVINHQILVSVHEDWLNGIQGQEKASQIGTIALDIPSGKYNPLQIRLEKGSWWKGTRAMFVLGMEHIKEGTDHLLFLVVLLLPAMLLLENGKWGNFAGIRLSLIRLIKIVTAFTIGHSFTLLIGTLGWIKFPQKPVEIVIALSILISAIHAIKPVFAGKETYIASGFGLFHGLAFSAVLSKLTLTPSTLALSILGFNLGIESMQIGIIVLIFPWLILMSLTPFYSWIKNLMALLASVAALTWMMERIFEKEYFITKISNHIAQFGIWYLFGLAFLSILLYITSVGLTKTTTKPADFR